MSRMISITAFAAAALAFALPFGAVSSCGGEEVRFTGVELATFTVPPDTETEGTLHTEVERNAGFFAFLALVAAVSGAVLALLGRGGGGICASLAIVALQLVLWAVLLTSDGGSELFIGYWLSLLLLVLVATAHLVRTVRARRRRGDSSWRYALGRIALVLMPSLAVVALGILLVLSTG